MTRSSGGATLENVTKITTRALAFVGIGAALGVAGCDATRDAAHKTEESLGEKLAPMQGRMGDASIKLQIKTKYADDPDIVTRKIQIDVKDGVVTLTGAQPTFEGRRHAEQYARDVKGVVRVDSKLTITPPGSD